MPIYSDKPAKTPDLTPFEPVLNHIQNKNIQEFTRNWLKCMPDYIFTISASSTGKYHPAHELGKGGLMRHMICVAKAVIYLTEPTGGIYPTQDRNKIDCMIAAGILHDMFKCGTQKDYNEKMQISQKVFTNFNHPRIAAYEIRHSETTLINDADKNLIADCIASHMGQWNTNKYQPQIEPLALPESLEQRIVHAADYLASRPDVSIGNF